MHGSWHGLYEINVDLLCYSKVLWIRSHRD
jgi:hypothetical protein